MNKKIRIGEVISDKMDKTIVVRCMSIKMHPLYKKRLRRYSKLYVHDEENQCKIGDEVEVIETRPLSKLKRWRVLKILKRKEQ